MFYIEDIEKEALSHFAETPADVRLDSLSEEKVSRELLSWMIDVIEKHSR